MALPERTLKADKVIEGFAIDGELQTGRGREEAGEEGTNGGEVTEDAIVGETMRVQIA